MLASSSANQPAAPDADGVAAMDIGLNNLAAVTSNQPGFVPLLVNGRSLKAINQRYNKERARLQSQLIDERHTSRRLEALTSCDVDDFFSFRSQILVGDRKILGSCLRRASV